MLRNTADMLRNHWRRVAAQQQLQQLYPDFQVRLGYQLVNNYQK
jgi:hypothetical protein